APSSVYRGKGWMGWADFLGTKNLRGSQRPFEEAREFARRLGLRNVRQWHVWARSAKRPSDVPANPKLVYAKKGWIAWGDWLGTGNVKGGEESYRSFDDARTHVRSLGLATEEEWNAWAKTTARPADIPKAP